MFNILTHANRKMWFPVMLNDDNLNHDRPLLRPIVFHNSVLTVPFRQLIQLWLFHMLQLPHCTKKHRDLINTIKIKKKEKLTSFSPQFCLFL